MRNSYLLTLLTALMMLAYGPKMQAQAPFRHVYNPDFMVGYPMITKVLNEYIEPYEFSGYAENDLFIMATDVILEVNGIDAKSDNAMDVFTTDSVISLKLLRWPEKELSIKFRNHLYNPENETGDLFSCLSIQTYQTTMPGIRVVKAKDVDFSKFKTYDFLIEGDDPLIDESILETFVNGGCLSSRMKRDKENPDVIFRIARNAEESMSATYVPPTTETINTGSTTNPVYNYITRTTSYVTKQRHRTVQHEGHTEVTNLSKLYLEIVALDASKLNDPNQKTAPEIWKLVYSGQQVNDNRPLIDRYKEIADLGGYPFQGDDANRVLDISCGARMIPSNDDKSLVVLGVAPNSRADRLGLKPMDIIRKINGKNKFKLVQKDKLRDYLTEEEILLGKLPGRLGLQVFLMGHLELVRSNYLQSSEFPALANKEDELLIERDGKKIKLKGSLWDPFFYHMESASFLKTARNKDRLVFITYNRIPFE